MLVLRERLQRYRPLARPATVAVAGLLLLAVADRYAHAPLVQARADVERRLQAVRRELAAARALHARRGELEARLLEVEERTAALRRDLDAGRRQPSFIRYVEDSAREAGAAVTRLEFADPEPVGETGYRRYPVTVEAVGPYPGIVAFVERMEAVAPFVAVDRLAVTSREPAGLPDGWARLVLSLSALGREDGGTGWDRELARWAAGTGRANPFASPAAPAAGD